MPSIDFAFPVKEMHTLLPNQFEEWILYSKKIHWSIDSSIKLNKVSFYKFTKEKNTRIRRSK